MSKGPWQVSPRAITRAVKGVEDAGRKVAKVEVVDGRIIITCGDGDTKETYTQVQKTADGEGEWDSI